MNKISHKLGLLFFSWILSFEIILFYILFTGIVDSRISEELSELKARGESHRHVLEKNFDKTTIEHVALMEAEAETDVVIMTHDGEILDKSNELMPGMEDLMEHERGSIPFDGMILESRWETEAYICTVSPIMIEDKIIGHVYMFKNTASIQKMISNLKHQFLVVGGFI